MISAALGGNAATSDPAGTADATANTPTQHAPQAEEDALKLSGPAENANVAQLAPADATKPNAEPTVADGTVLDDVSDIPTIQPPASEQAPAPVPALEVPHSMPPSALAGTAVTEPEAADVPLGAASRSVPLEPSVDVPAPLPQTASPAMITCQSGPESTALEPQLPERLELQAAGSGRVLTDTGSSEANTAGRQRRAVQPSAKARLRPLIAGPCMPEQTRP